MLQEFQDSQEVQSVTEDLWQHLPSLQTDNIPKTQQVTLVGVKLIYLYNPLNPVFVVPTQSKLFITRQELYVAVAMFLSLWPCVASCVNFLDTWHEKCVLFGFPQKPEVLNQCLEFANANDSNVACIIPQSCHHLFSSPVSLISIDIKWGLCRSFCQERLHTHFGDLRNAQLAAGEKSFGQNLNCCNWGEFIHEIVFRCVDVE